MRLSHRLASRMRPPVRRASVPPQILAALLAILPFLYGAVHLPARIGYVLAAAGLLVAHLAIRAGARRRIAPRGVITVLAIAAVAWAGLALVPLPLSILRLVAPQTYALAIEAPARVGISPRDWHAIAVDPAAAAEAWITAAAHLCIFVVASASFAGRRGARTFAATLAFTGAGVAVLAILEALTHAPRIYWIGLAREQFYGTFVNGNHTASLLAVGCVAGLGLLLRERDPGKRAAWGVAAVVCGVGVMHSLSRGGMLALAIGLGAFLAGAVATQAASRRRSADELGRFFRRHAILLMLVALAVFYLSWLQPQRIGREISTLTTLKLPQDYRTRVWEDSMRAVHDWPLTGSGGGSFSSVFPAYRTFVTDVRTEMAESEYVQIAVENGVVGVALLGGGALLLLVLFGARYAGDPMRFSGAHLGLAAGLVVLATHSAVDFPLRLPAMGAIAAGIAGALAGALQRTRIAAPSRRHLPAANPDVAEGPGSAEGVATGVAAAAESTAARRARRLRPRALLPRTAAWALLPAGIGIAFPTALRAERAPGTLLPDLRADLRASPADSRRWVRLARVLERQPDRDRDEASVIAAWKQVAHLDPSRPALLRGVATALARAGDPEGAAETLETAIALCAAAGRAQEPVLSALRLDLAENRALLGDAAGAERALAAAGPEAAKAARGHYVKAELLALSGPGASPSAGATEDPAIDEFLAAADLFARERNEAAAAEARRRALLLAINAAHGDDPAVARARIQHVAFTGDPGAALRVLESAVQRHALDAKAIFGADGPELVLDDFSAGTPRLRPVNPGIPRAIDGDVRGGGEILAVRYPNAATVHDLFEAPLAVTSSDPRLALRITVAADGHLGDQACVRAGARRLFGHAASETANPHVFTIDNLVSGNARTTLDAWCFDTRGRPGPYRFTRLSLLLTQPEAGP